MPMQTQTNNISGSTRRRSCPCQHIPLSLSSSTSAEYGDVVSLARRMKAAATVNTINTILPGISNNNDGGITPLHLASQHGHPAAVSLLLLEGGCDADTGLPMMPYNNNQQQQRLVVCGATPLHRAAFSGAISSMQVLLSWKRPSSSSLGGGTGVNLLARDVSFGDNRTPLHKAVAGGRPLAVQLLLNALKSQQLLVDGLNIRDAYGYTPLELVRQFTMLDDDSLELERCSVRRWDLVAGGMVADWDTCQQLLEGCDDNDIVTADDSQTVNDITTNATTTTANQQQQQQQQQQRRQQKVLLPEMPPCTNNDDCIDGKCRTAAWENAFRMALVTSMKSSLDNNHNHHESTKDDDDDDNNNSKTNSNDNHGIMKDMSPLNVVMGGVEEKRQPSTEKSLSNIEMTTPTTTAAVMASRTHIGRECDMCSNPTTVLFRAKNNKLVCKSCRL